MTETKQPESFGFAAQMPPRRGVLAGYEPFGDERARLSALPAMARFSFRGDEAAAKICETAFGVSLSQPLNRAASAGGRASLHLGPDEWLLLAEEEAMLILPAPIQIAFSLVDIAHRNAALALEGSGAAICLNAGCPLDLDLSAFPVGMATRTIFNKTEIVLWRQEPERFHIEVTRSFAPYLWQGLREAIEDLD